MIEKLLERCAVRMKWTTEYRLFVVLHLSVARVFSHFEVSSKIIRYMINLWQGEIILRYAKRRNVPISRLRIAGQFHEHSCHFVDQSCDQSLSDILQFHHTPVKFRWGHFDFFRKVHRIVHYTLYGTFKLIQRILYRVAGGIAFRDVSEFQPLDPINQLRLHTGETSFRIFNLK